MFCQERSKLKVAYLEALRRLDEASKTVPLLHSDRWSYDVERLREECDQAFEKLMAHRMKHDC